MWVSYFLHTNYTVKYDNSAAGYVKRIIIITITVQL